MTRAEMIAVADELDAQIDRISRERPSDRGGCEEHTRYSPDCNMCDYHTGIRSAMYRIEERLRRRARRLRHQARGAR
jgi:hypothetical protein